MIARGQRFQYFRYGKVLFGVLTKGVNYSLTGIYHLHGSVVKLYSQTQSPCRQDVLGGEDAYGD